MKKKFTSLMKGALPAFVCAALLFSSCAKNELEDLQLTNPSKNSNATTSLNPPTPVIPSDAMISITHGTCMGSCPNYMVTVSRDGNVVYTGYHHVAVRGTVKYKISADQAYQLGYMMEHGGFFNFSNEYILIPDAQRFETSLVWESKIKSVVDCGINVPPALLQMRQKVERALDVQRFIDGTPNAEQVQNTE